MAPLSGWILLQNKSGSKVFWKILYGCTFLQGSRCTAGFTGISILINREGSVFKLCDILGCIRKTPGLTCTSNT